MHNNINKNIIRWLIYTLSILSFLAYSLPDDKHESVLVFKQRLAEEQRLYEVSKGLYENIKKETSKISEITSIETNKELQSKNYLLEQLRLQLAKINLQAQRIEIDKATVEEEIIASDNAIYQLEDKLQSTIGLAKSDYNINSLQSSISYHKDILEINNKRLKVLTNNYDLINKLKEIEEKNIDVLQRAIDIQIKQNNLLVLDNKEKIINNQIKSWLDQEIQAKEQIQRLDLIGKDDNKNLVAYNDLQNKIIESVNERGILELELGFIRLKTRLDDIAYLFDNSKIEILKNKKNLAERIARLQKEASAIKNLVNSKINFTNNYVLYVDKQKQLKSISVNSYDKIMETLAIYNEKYKSYLIKISKIVVQVSSYNDKLKDLYLKDVSLRQILPDDIKEWSNIFQDIFSMPYLLSKQVFLTWQQFTSYIKNNTNIKLLKLILFEMLAILFTIIFYKFISVLNIKYFKISLDSFSSSAFYILAKFVSSNRFIIALLFNFYLIFWVTNITGIFANIIFLLSSLYLLIRFALLICYTFLIENTLGISGDDSRLYKGLKYSLIFGGVLSTLMILGQAFYLPINTLGFLDRLFMLFLLAVSYPLIINWQVVPQLIIDSLEPKPYVRKALWLLGIILPVTILSNAALGIIGYVNLAWKIAVAEFQFSLVIVFWLILKGFISELMELTSRFVIRNINSGWLWTESVLKPLHTVINFILFFSAILGLVFIYGWNRNIELLQLLNNIFNFHLFTFENNTTSIPVKVFVRDLINFSIVFALVVWATKWSREFSYRFLYAKTKDLAVRNSFSVFTQYATVIIGLIVILKVLGIPTATLMVTIGGLLFFLGFGLRDIISNYISGIILLIERPIRTGDFVTIGEHEGKVTKIGMRSLTVQSFDNMEAIVPNTDTITKTLINWTFKDTVIRQELELRIAYNEDITKIQELIFEVLKGNEEILEEPESKLYFKEFSDTAIIAKIYYFIDLNKSPSRGFVRTAVMSEMNRLFKLNDIKVAYPRQTVKIEENQ